VLKKNNDISRDGSRKNGQWIVK